MKRARLLCLFAVLSLVGSALAFFWNDWQVGRYLQAARAALKSRDADQALTALEAASRLDPKSGEVQFWMARAYRRQGRLNDVRRCLQQARTAGISRSRIQREEWLAMAQAGQMTEAEPHLSELLFDPGDDGPEICEAFANGYMLSYRYAQAFAVVDAWQKDFPNDPQPHVFRGMVAKSNAAWATAVEHFQRAFDLAPQRQDIRLLLANALLNLRNTSEAASHFQQLLKSCPNDAAVQNGWGRTLLDLGRLDDARDILTKALKAHPKNFDVILALGQVELNANRFDEALPLLQQAAELDPDDLEARNSLAVALQRVGRTAEAKSHFEFVAKINEEVVRMQMLREQVLVNPKNIDARFEISELLRSRRNPSDRIKWLHSILEIDPKHQQAHAALAEHYETIGDNESALRHRTQTSPLAKDLIDRDKP